MYTPFDWQEAIGNRAEYAEQRLKQGAPVLGLSIDVGVLLFSFRRQSPKLFEIYDRLAMGAIGQQADIESVRVAAVEFASREGYQRSESDVTIQRVVTTISSPVKRAFSDFSSSPFLMRTVFAEVNSSPDEDIYFLLNYDGDYNLSKKFAIASGYGEESEALPKALEKISKSLTPTKAIAKLEEAWRDHAKEQEIEPASLEGLVWEALLIERSSSKENRFQVFTQPAK